MASWRSEHRDARQVTELEGPEGPQGALGMHHAMPTPWQGSCSQEPPPAPIFLCPRAAYTQEREIKGHHWLFHPSFLGSFSASATFPGSGPPRPDTPVLPGLIYYAGRGGQPTARTWSVTTFLGCRKLTTPPQVPRRA